jgi:L-glyceraldehyde 3-phosphate reductase
MVHGSAEEQLRAIERAIDLGINYFDTSPDYGDGVSETNLGNALRTLRVRPIITTKVEVRAANLSDIASHVERSVDSSLERLGVGYVDIVQIHNGPTATRPDLKGREYRVLGIEDYLQRNGAIEGLERIKRAGKTRFLGFCCRGNDGGPVRQLIDTGLFHLVNVIYTLMNPSAVIEVPRGLKVSPDFGQVIPYARERGVGTAIYSPLGGGVLTDAMVGGQNPHPLAAAAQQGEGGNGRLEHRRYQARQASGLAFLSRGGRHSLAQSAIRFILMEPGVTAVLGGFSDAHQVEDVAAASGAGPLTPEEMARIEMVWRANFGS